MTIVIQNRPEPIQNALQLFVLSQDDNFTSIHFTCYWTLLFYFHSIYCISKQSKEKRNRNIIFMALEMGSPAIKQKYIITIKKQEVVSCRLYVAFSFLVQFVSFVIFTSLFIYFFSSIDWSIVAQWAG